MSTVNQSELRALIAKTILKSKAPLKMGAIAVKVGLVAEGQPVPSGIAARIRVQLRHLLDSNTIGKQGDKATRVYLAPDKVSVPTKPSKKTAPKTAPKKAKPAKAAKKKAAPKKRKKAGKKK